MKSENSDNSQQSDSSARAVKACRIISIIGIVLAVTLLIPFGEIGSWGVGRPVLFGMGIGFALTGAAFLALDAMDVRFRGNFKTLVAFACIAILSVVPVALYKATLFFGPGFSLGGAAGLSSAAFAGSLLFALSLSCILRFGFSLCEARSNWIEPSRLDMARQIRVQF